ncbi:MAG: sugar-transfer associated ATP-grasp domain-containing protein [Propionivibrio sp.]
MQRGTVGWFGRRAARFHEYRKWAAQAKEQTGKDAVAQLRDVRALKRSGGQCGISDYYWFKLYDEGYLYGGGARDFLGWRLQQAFSLALNARSAVLPAWDKCVFMQLSSAAGLPVAPVSACFHPTARISETLGRHLKNRAEVAHYLRNPSLYPLFGKPAYSQQGYGSVYLAGFDPATDSFNLLNGKSLPVETFLERLEKPIDARYHRPECGFLFQQTFTPAPEINALTQWSAICGVRVICLNGPEGVQPIRAIWKIAVPPNHVDNFSLGKYGNLLADVDLASGRISRVINGLWPGTQVFSAHPLSGRALSGFRLPGWESILDVCRRGGSVFPLMKIHHWDFAITDRGPLILELNDLGGTEIAQVHGHGLLTDETRAFLKRYADTEAHPWIRAL